MLLLLLLLPWTLPTVHGSSGVGTNSPTVFVVVGAPGEPEYGSGFARQAELWDQASASAGATVSRIGLAEPGQTNDLEQLRQSLEREPREGPGELWIVLIGHGTFDGKEARFNLRGPDLLATDLARWLQPVHRRIIVINGASCSAPFLNKLSGSNRIIITATRSGNEQNYARLGQFFAQAITDPQGDLDQDGQVSVLEAFLSASRSVAEFYRTEGRLATEHALLDDNGDGLGTASDWFRGTRAVKKAREGASLDGLQAQQVQLVRSELEQQLTPAVRVRRDELEGAVVQLREHKAKMPEDEYYDQLEKILLELARLYR